MICPSCGSEYREGFARCADCDVDLVEPPPPPAEEPPVELVKVYETSNAAVIPLVESLLDDAGIEFMTKGAEIQDFIGGGRFPAGFNLIVGPVEFHVRDDAADEARAILDTLEIPADASEETADEESDEQL